ncbi:MAG: hypothetical protein AAGG75_26740 [Bacteroidota bacterium]
MKPWKPSAKNFKIKLLCCFCLLLLGTVLLPPQPASGFCGIADWEEEGYSFLHTGLVVDTANFAPFLLRFDDLYERIGTRVELKQRSNLEEWRERFCDVASIADLRAVIYESSLDELQLLSTAVSSKNLRLDFRMANNALALHMKEKKCVEAADYFVFAKTCEPHAVLESMWDTPDRDTVAMKRLIREGKRLFLKTKSNYIKLRYLYQVVRLAHYAKDYPLTLSIYDELYPRMDPEESILNDWILGHRAGAMRAMGQTVQAAYHFMQIFLDSPSRRESAYRSFYIETDEQWEQCMLLCQNDRERAGLYALRASAEDSRAAEEMEKIYELTPDNKHLELLLVREIRKMEQGLLGAEFYDGEHPDEYIKNKDRRSNVIGPNLLRLQKLVRRVVEEQQVKHLRLWQLAEGYLEYLAGNFYEAGKTLNDLAMVIENDTLKEQLAAFDLALKVHELKQMDEETEEQVFRMIVDNPVYKQFSDFPDFINDRISTLYLDEGRVGKAFRCHYDLSDLKYNPQLEIIDDLLAVCNQPEPNLLEEMLIIDQNGVNLRNRLLDIKGSLLMTEGNLEAALAVFQQIPRENWDDFKFNPFLEHFDDCVLCPIPDTLKTYNKVGILERIFDLQFKGQADMQGGARHFYALGNAFYNMSYFGRSWDVMDYFRSGATRDRGSRYVHELYGAPFGNNENTDLTLAKAYFERAQQLAGNDSELAARATFMAARCERTEYFMSDDYLDKRGWGMGREIPNVPDEHNLHYQKLVKDYNHTEFYQFALRECLYFRAYALN